MDIRPFEDADEPAVIEGKLRAMGCAKINLQIRRDNLEAIAFYQRIGVVEDAAVGYGKRLERDDETPEHGI
jgi:ribosomal protein S18 acetylase RimI-like enzyme